MKIAHTFLNTFKSYKVLYNESKTYVILSFISVIVSSLNNYAGILLVSGAIYAIEKQLEFKMFLIIVCILSGIYLFLDIITSLIYFKFIIPYSEKLKNRLGYIYHSVPSLKFDYELLERKENQELLSLGLMGGQGIIDIFDSNIEFLYNLFTLLIGTTFFILVNPYLIIIITVILILKTFIMSKSNKLSYLQWQDTLTDRRRIFYCNDITRRVAMGKDLRVFHMEKFIKLIRLDSVKNYLAYLKILRNKTSFLNVLLNILDLFIQLALYGFLAYEVIKQNMLIATFTLLLGSINAFFTNYNLLLNNYLNMERDSERIDDLFKVNSSEYILDYEIKEYNEEFREIEFQNVSYKYYLAEEDTLSNINFTLKKGEKLALVGLNGAGKTTLIKLMCGLYHPTGGNIFINGINIEKFDRSVLASLISPVFQDVVNYNMSLINNITFSKDVDKERLDKIIQELDMEDLINKLPNGYNTILGKELYEEGIELSGGENQKIALARSIYKLSPVKILDEPTSFLDSLSEGRLYNNLNNILKENTTIFISHRLSSTKFCDNIILLDNGKIIEKGTHKQLMELNKEYARLFNMQASYYSEGEEDEK